MVKFKQFVEADNRFQAATKDAIKKEKEADKIKHDKMMDRARTSDTRAANRAK